MLKPEDEEEMPIVKQYMKDGTMSQIRSNYHTYWAAISACLELKTCPILSSTAIDTSHSERKSYDLKLPRIEIPSFDGKYEEWTASYNLFIATIDNNKTLETVQKLHYLLKAVTGEAHSHTSKT